MVTALIFGLVGDVAAALVFAVAGVAVSENGCFGGVRRTGLHHRRTHALDDDRSS
jgi:hypothetical protein